MKKITLYLILSAVLLCACGKETPKETETAQTAVREETIAVQDETEASSEETTVLPEETETVSEEAETLPSVTGRWRAEGEVDDERKIWNLYLVLEEDGYCGYWISDPLVKTDTIEEFYEGEWTEDGETVKLDLTLSGGAAANKKPDAALHIRGKLEASPDGDGLRFTHVSGDALLPGREKRASEFVPYESHNMTETESPDASGTTRDEVLAFLSSPGANGLLNGAFSDIDNAVISITDMVYQADSTAVDRYEVMDLLEEAGEEIYTDISCLTTKEVDRLVREILGVNGDHRSISYDAAYLEPLDVWYLQHGDTNYVAFTLEEVTAGKETVTAILTDVGTYDTRDIRVTLERNALGGLRYRSIERIGDPDPSMEFIFPSSDLFSLTEEDLRDLGAWELKVARNEIYARYGRKFNNSDLRAYFESCSWYVGCIEPEDFDESWLSPVERANIRLIEEFESKF